MGIFTLKSYDFRDQTDELSNPLKIYDPLNLINELCNSLISIWNHRNTGTLKLREFKIFKLSGRGLLQGQRFEGDQLTTLLAYCGGEIRNEDGKYQGKCGFTPLVLGRHHTCQDCGRLICSKCSCCHKDCINFLLSQFHP